VFLESVGFSISELVTFKLTPDEIKVEIIARDVNGKYIIVNDAVASHTLIIPFVD
jgi:hypothetical protein